MGSIDVTILFFVLELRVGRKGVLAQVLTVDL